MNRKIKPKENRTELEGTVRVVRNIRGLLERGLFNGEVSLAVNEGIEFLTNFEKGLLDRLATTQPPPPKAKGGRS